MSTDHSFVAYYNQHRYHESFDNFTPADVYFGRAKEVQAQRQQTKQRTFQQRRQHDLLIPFYSR